MAAAYKNALVYLQSCTHRKLHFLFLSLAMQTRSGGNLAMASAIRDASVGAADDADAEVPRTSSETSAASLAASSSQVNRPPQLHDVEHLLQSSIAKQT